MRHESRGWKEWGYSLYSHIWIYAQQNREGLIMTAMVMGSAMTTGPDGHHQYYIFLSQSIVHALDYEHLDEVMLLIQTCNQECSIPLCFSIGNSQKASYFQ